MKTNVFQYVACLLLTAGAAYGQAQDSTQTNFMAKNAVYLELGGTSVIYSLNYDRLFSDRNKWKVGARAGFALLHFSLYDSRVVGEVYALRGRQNHYLEFGLGTLYRAQRELRFEQLINGQRVETSRMTEPSAIGLVPRIGYRFQKQTGGSVFRAGFTPVLERTDGTTRLTPWVGISYGISF